MNPGMKKRLAQLGRSGNRLFRIGCRRGRRLPGHLTAGQSVDCSALILTTGTQTAHLSRKDRWHVSGVADPLLWVLCPRGSWLARLPSMQLVPTRVHHPLKKRLQRQRKLSRCRA